MNFKNQDNSWKPLLSWSRLQSSLDIIVKFCDIILKFANIIWHDQPKPLLDKSSSLLKKLFQMVCIQQSSTIKYKFTKNFMKSFTQTLLQEFSYWHPVVYVKSNKNRRLITSIKLFFWQVLVMSLQFSLLYILYLHGNSTPPYVHDPFGVALAFVVISLSIHLPSLKSIENNFAGSSGICPMVLLMYDFTIACPLKKFFSCR